jgi:FMN phosphatase YigB (HAD superfamily)
MNPSPAHRSHAPALVCFDVGGVLVRLCSAWDEACLAAGLDIRRATATPAVTVRRRELVMLFDSGSISLDEWAVGVEKAIDAVYSAEELKRIHRALLKSEYAGALALVERLETAGVETACLSNTNAAHWLRLAHFEDERAKPGLPEFPSVVRLKHRIASHVLGVVKPKPEIYRRFERATGARGAEILFFDDREENVVAARQGGWRAERVDPTGDPISEARRHLEAAGLL